MPKSERKFGSKKTTLPNGKTEYQKEYMRDYRKRKRAEIEKLKEELWLYRGIFGSLPQYEVI